MHKGCVTRGEPTPGGAATGVSPDWTELVKLAGPGSMSGLLMLFFSPTRPEMAEKQVFCFSFRVTINRIKCKPLCTLYQLVSHLRGSL